MIEGLRGGWDRFWFQPRSPAGLIAARTIVAANAFWVLLSLGDLPDVSSWPPEFWASVDGFLRARYLVGVLPTAAEYGLYALLHLALLAALLGIRPRAACLVSGLLLYHFAPLQELFLSHVGPFFGGLTLPTLALLVLAATETPTLGAAASPEFSWPLRLIQVLITFNYLFAGYAKLFYSGPSWVSADNIRETLYRIGTWGPTAPPWTAFLAAQPALLWTIAGLTIPLELLFPLVLFSRTAARILVPATLIAHLLVIPAFGLFFYNIPLLLLFADWDAVGRWLAASPLGPTARRALTVLSPGRAAPRRRRAMSEHE
jgi:hypothetical protein